MIFWEDKENYGNMIFWEDKENYGTSVFYGLRKKARMEMEAELKECDVNLDK